MNESEVLALKVALDAGDLDAARKLVRQAYARWSDLFFACFGDKIDE